MRVLVTGGAGYIGRHVVAALEVAGCEPVWLDNRPGVGPGVLVDLLDRDALAAAMGSIQPAGVIHLAAHSSVAESVQNPAKYLQNAEMCRNLNRATASIPAVLASSAAVYGEGGADPIAETVRPAPTSPYGWSKLESEAALPRATALRFFNVAGGHGDEADHIVPRAIQAKGRGGVLTVNGDGRAVRDFVHVEDVARATVAALLALSVGRRPEVLNICTGRGRSVSDVAKAVGVRTIYGLPRAGDPSRLVGDNHRALRAIGWAPWFGFEGIIASALNPLRAAA